MSFKNVNDFYQELVSSEHFSNKLKDKLQRIKNEEEYKIFIQDELLPLAKTLGYDFSMDDILTYEHQMLQILNENELESVTGGMGLMKNITTTFISALALAGGACALQTLNSAQAMKTTIKKSTDKKDTKSTSKQSANVKAHSERDKNEADKNINSITVANDFFKRELSKTKTYNDFIKQKKVIQSEIDSLIKKKENLQSERDLFIKKKEDIKKVITKLEEKAKANKDYKTYKPLIDKLYSDTDELKIESTHFLNELHSLIKRINELEEKCDERSSQKIEIETDEMKKLKELRKKIRHQSELNDDTVSKSEPLFSFDDYKKILKYKNFYDGPFLDSEEFKDLDEKFYEEFERTTNLLWNKFSGKGYRLDLKFKDGTNRYSILYFRNGNWRVIELGTYSDYVDYLTSLKNETGTRDLAVFPLETYIESVLEIGQDIQMEVQVHIGKKIDLKRFIGICGLIDKYKVNFSFPDLKTEYSEYLDKKDPDVLKDIDLVVKALGSFNVIDTSEDFYDKFIGYRNLLMGRLSDMNISNYKLDTYLVDGKIRHAVLYFYDGKWRVTECENYSEYEKHLMNIGTKNEVNDLPYKSPVDYKSFWSNENAKIIEKNAYLRKKNLQREENYYNTLKRQMQVYQAFQEQKEQNPNLKLDDLLKQIPLKPFELSPEVENQKFQLQVQVDGSKVDLKTFLKEQSLYLNQQKNYFLKETLGATDQLLEEFSKNNIPNSYKLDLRLDNGQIRHAVLYLHDKQWYVADFENLFPLYREYMKHLIRTGQKKYKYEDLSALPLETYIELCSQKKRVIQIQVQFAGKKIDIRKFIGICGLISEDKFHIKSPSLRKYCRDCLDKDDYNIRYYIKLVTQYLGFDIIRTRAIFEGAKDIQSVTRIFNEVWQDSKYQKLNYEPICMVKFTLKDGNAIYKPVCCTPNKKNLLFLITMETAKELCEGINKYAKHKKLTEVSVCVSADPNYENAFEIDIDSFFLALAKFGSHFENFSTLKKNLKPVQTIPSTFYKTNKNELLNSIKILCEKLNIETTAEEIYKYINTENLLKNRRLRKVGSFLLNSDKGPDIPVYSDTLGNLCYIKSDKILGAISPDNINLKDIKCIQTSYSDKDGLKEFDVDIYTFMNIYSYIFKESNIDMNFFNNANNYDCDLNQLKAFIEFVCNKYKVSYDNLLSDLAPKDPKINSILSGYDFDDDISLDDYDSSTDNCDTNINGE